MSTDYPESYHPRALAYLGDAVFELFIREQAMALCSNQVEGLHLHTTQRVNAAFQVQLLYAIEPLLTEAEKEIVRRGRNVPVSTGRRSAQALHRQSTGFEALLGYLHLTNPERLQVLFQAILPLLQENDSTPKA